MAYIVNQDIINRVGDAAALQLTTDSGGVIDQTKLDGVREGVEGEANSYMAPRLATPVDLTGDPEWAATLRERVLDIAVYRLLLLREQASVHYEKAFERAIDWFKGIGKGDIMLPGAATAAATTANNPPAEYGSKAQNLSKMGDSL